MPSETEARRSLTGKPPARDWTGLAPREALARFLKAVGDRGVVRDEPDYDRHWLGMLADAAGVSLGVVKINYARKLIEQTG